MYDTRFARTGPARKDVLLIAGIAVLFCGTTTQSSRRATAQDLGLSPAIVRKISGLTEKLEITSNSSRILTLDKKIPRVQVNNPDLLTVTPLSATQIQVSAKKAGVTQVNLWDEDGNIHTVDVLIYGDARELQHALQIQFPHSSINVYRYSESLVLKGFVDRPDYVSQIMRLAEDYAPKVINNISVGGVQQILLRVKVMEVSRTKLRRLGVDFAQISSSGAFVANSVSGVINNVTQANGRTVINDNGGSTFQFGIVDGADAFFGFLDALQTHNIAKVLAEPNIVAVSGRPAQFNAGGEIPILVPQSLGTTSIEFKKFGTQVDFLPLVLGNGNIRLEVRPRVSEIDDSRSVQIENFTIPALTVREVDTAVEMKAGQTFALAGLIQERSESQQRGLPFITNIPVLGVPFRRTEEEVNEIELLIMVTPQFVDAMEPHEAPCGGPGLNSVQPTDCGLLIGGHLEVPPHCNPIRGLHACGEPGAPCAGGCDGGSCGGADAISTDGGMMVPSGGDVMLPGGSGYDDGGARSSVLTPSTEVTPVPGPSASIDGSAPMHGKLMLPPGPGQPNYVIPGDNGGAVQNMPPIGPGARTSGRMAPRPYSPGRSPSYVRNASSPNNRQAQPASATVPPGELSDLLGPVGYDVQK